MTLCSNCLQNGGKPRPIGYEKGNQRDPIRETITLCDPCWGFLEHGDLRSFHERYSYTRQIVRT